MARRESSRRAMSLLELAIVGVMLALLALAGISRFGHNTLANGGAEGFTRQLSLALAHARRGTISTGDNHYLQLSPASGNVTSFVLMRRAAGGDVQVDQIRTVPQDVTVTSALKDTNKKRSIWLVPVGKKRILNIYRRTDNALVPGNSHLRSKWALPRDSKGEQFR